MHGGTTVGMQLIRRGALTSSPEELCAHTHHTSIRGAHQLTCQCERYQTDASAGGTCIGEQLSALRSAAMRPKPCSTKLFMSLQNSDPAAQQRVCNACEQQQAYGGCTLQDARDEDGLVGASNAREACDEA